MITEALAIKNVEHDYEVRALWWAIASMVMTTVHHVYGAVIYHTPWRDHAAIVAVVTVLVSAAAFRIHRSPATSKRAGKIAFWSFVVVILLTAVLAIGLFEGGYNHTLKNILYFTTGDAALMQRLFPPPTYEMPNDAFFEITGVLQFPLGLVTGWELIKTIKSVRRSQR
jgi:hypothetical protein